MASILKKKQAIAQTGEAKQAKFAALRQALNARPTAIARPKASKPKGRRGRSVQPRWKAGYLAYLESPRWAAFKIRLYAERGHQCERCGATKAIQVHHLTYERLGQELLRDVEILCRECHEKEHGINPVRTIYSRS